jgi:hypothetical protein
MDDVDVPRGELPTLLARLFAAQMDLRDAALPWLVGELPVPMFQLHGLVERLRVCDEIAAEIRGEARAVYREIQASRERSGDEEPPPPSPVNVLLGRWSDAA